MMDQKRTPRERDDIEADEENERLPSRCIILPLPPAASQRTT